VAKRLIKWLIFLVLALIVIMGAIYGSLAWSVSERATDHTFFNQTDARPLVIAHRGGAGIAPENTLRVFEKAVNLGVDVLEIDVRGTRDGAIVVIHDATVDRTTDGTGRVGEMTLTELKKLDAGHGFSPDGGKTFPYRGSGVTIPTLEEVFRAFPEMKFNIEPKPGSPSIVKPLCSIIREHGKSDSVVVASFSQSILDEFRNECAGVATSASTTEVGKFLTMYKTGLTRSFNPVMQALQVPVFTGVTREFVEAARERNLKVHVWTVNEIAEMERLLEAGVDGIMTDYPDRLLSLIKQQVANKQQ
jgi:glycerophosphoryl diester phosphodiesterase